MKQLRKALVGGSLLTLGVLCGMLIESRWLLFSISIFFLYLAYRLPHVPANRYENRYRNSMPARKERARKLCLYWKRIVNLLVAQFAIWGLCLISLVPGLFPTVLGLVSLILVLLFYFYVNPGMLERRDEAVRSRHFNSPREVAKRKKNAEIEAAREAKKRQELEKKEMEDSLRRQREYDEWVQEVEKNRMQRRLSALNKAYRIYSLREKGAGFVPPRLTLEEYDEAYFTPQQEAKAREEERERRDRLLREKEAQALAEERREREERKLVEARRQEELKTKREELKAKMEEDIAQARSKALFNWSLVQGISDTEQRVRGEADAAGREAQIRSKYARLLREAE